LKKGETTWKNDYTQKSEIGSPNQRKRIGIGGKCRHKKTKRKNRESRPAVNPVEKNERVTGGENV